jgi:hypothetical protein
MVMSGFTPSHSLHSILPVLQAGKQEQTGPLSTSRHIDSLWHSLHSILPVLRQSNTGSV